MNSATEKHSFSLICLSLFAHEKKKKKHPLFAMFVDFYFLKREGGVSI